MRLTSLCAFVVLAFGTQLAAQTQNSWERQVLPPKARMLVSEKFPGWRIKRLADLVDDDKELWAKAHPKECPGIAIGHFETPNQTAYGLLLIPASGTETSYKILVLSKSATTDVYSVRVLDHAEGQPGSGSGLVISKVPPGKYSGFDTAQSVRLRLDALEAEWIEKSSVLYYWRNGRYRALQTSD